MNVYIFRNLKIGATARCGNGEALHIFSDYCNEDKKTGFPRFLTLMLNYGFAQNQSLRTPLLAYGKRVRWLFCAVFHHLLQEGFIVAETVVRSCNSVSIPETASATSPFRYHTSCLRTVFPVPGCSGPLPRKDIQQVGNARFVLHIVANYGGSSESVTARLIFFTTDFGFPAGR